MTPSELKDFEAQHGLFDLGASLARALADSADPAAAWPRAKSLLEALAAHDGAALREMWTTHREAALRALATLSGAAPFLVSVLARHPDWLPRLAAENLKEPRDPQDLANAIEQALAGATLEEAGERLRHAKYYELARITIRELSPDLVPERDERVVLAELSQLADALLDRAVKIASARLERQIGAAEWLLPDEQVFRPGFCVLALGKLGSEELNYSSDVDLIYVHEPAPAPLHGGQSRSPEEHFSRLAVELGRIVSSVTGEGFLYRIDLDLRPEGSQGAIVLSTLALGEYYETRAATWEKAAFMKARPVAGDTQLGWRVVRAVAPMIYRRAMDLASVDAIRGLKERIEEEKGRREGPFNVKIGSGGIRDIEFVAQAMQLLHGGRIPQIRGRSTAGALESLRGVDLLDERRAEGLLSAYLFLRRLENRIQMVEERQVYELPTASEDRVRLARAMGFHGDDALDELERSLEDHRSRVRSAFSELFPNAPPARILELFERFGGARPHSLHRMRLFEELAKNFAHAIESGPDPERAINNLARFVEGLGGRSFYYELLLDRPELVGRLAGLFAASEYLSGVLASHPRLIEPIFADPETLLLDHAGLERSFDDIRSQLAREGRTEPELDLDALRLFHKRELVNVGLLDLIERITPAEATGALSEVGEVAIERALELAVKETSKRGEGWSGEFLVVAMGKLATRELTYGSDLDLIFLHDTPRDDAHAAVAIQESSVRLAQKLIWALQTRTSEGICYTIDTRLRPSGNQGLLVTSLASFAAYHQKSAALWEHQAMLRARAVGGSERLGRAFEEIRLEVLRRPLHEDAAAEIHRIRQRMESEIAHEDRQRRDFKTGRGGLTDIETAVQYLQLRHRDQEELLQVDRTEAHLERLESLGLLAPDDAAAFRRGWSFLTRLSSRLRIVDNRSISDLDAERGDLDGLARLLGYPAGGREGAARRRLLDDYREITEAVRAAYLHVLGL